MIYEVRVKEWMSSKTISLGRYYKNKENAIEDARKMNESLNMHYHVHEIELEDGDE